MAAAGSTIWGPPSDLKVVDTTEKTSAQGAAARDETWESQSTATWSTVSLGGTRTHAAPSDASWEDAGTLDDFLADSNPAQHGSGVTAGSLHISSPAWWSEWEAFNAHLGDPRDEDEKQPTTTMSWMDHLPVRRLYMSEERDLCMNPVIVASAHRYISVRRFNRASAAASTQSRRGRLQALGVPSPRPAA
eukprot:CAMPEP_0179141928 /NCGR_PEP_ID=MMETSP0796-20121207/68126_1 /TAXON_ID=73915 /ORGANISM="Pyrodinium bahamense, Strain pbaha01" /LENGTH=189 /DNA_ID=CAMNT_0020841741 /DNA_START=60 /DNA_END=626 /DNA_ORIENTATION=-